MDLIIYHENCADGICAAAIAKAKYPDARLHAASYGDDPPDVTGLDVLIVDFSYSREVLEGRKTIAMHSSTGSRVFPETIDVTLGAGLVSKASSLLVLDHHKTAQSELEGLPYAIFDMDRSGAGMAWLRFFPGRFMPWVVRYVEDGDLYRFALPHARAVRAYLQSLPFAIETWQKHLREGEDLPLYAVKQGQALLRGVQKYVESTSSSAYTRTFAGIEGVPVVNASYMYTSELLHSLAQGAPFSVAWRYIGDGYSYSLRSAPEGHDVSEIAKRFGGGGHKHAAGFSTREPVEGTTSPAQHGLWRNGKDITAGAKVFYPGLWQERREGKITGLIVPILDGRETESKYRPLVLPNMDLGTGEVLAKSMVPGHFDVCDWEWCNRATPGVWYQERVLEDAIGPCDMNDVDTEDISEKWRPIGWPCE